MAHPKQQTGFTIVELLIVVVVIAILAAITIIAYNGIVQRSNTSAIQSALSQVAKKLGVYSIDNAETYPNSFSALNIDTSGNVTYQYSVNNSSTPPGYCVTATARGVSYYIGSNYVYTGSAPSTVNQPNPASGACPGHGSNGVAVNNYSYNPSVEVSAASLTGTNGTTYVRDTSKASQGSASELLTLPNAAAGAVGVLFFDLPSLGQANNLQPNATYTASAYVYVPTGTVDVYLTIQGTGRLSKVDPPGRLTSLKNQWVRIYNTFTTNASGALQLYILNNTATGVAGTQLWVDGIMISEGTSPNVYADGNSPGWMWRGSAANSSSVGPAL